MVSAMIWPCLWSEAFISSGPARYPGKEQACFTPETEASTLGPSRIRHLIRRLSPRARSIAPFHQNFAPRFQALRFVLPPWRKKSLHLDANREGKSARSKAWGHIAIIPAPIPPPACRSAAGRRRPGRDLCARSRHLEPSPSRKTAAPPSNTRRSPRRRIRADRAGARSRRSRTPCTPLATPSRVHPSGYATLRPAGAPPRHHHGRTPPPDNHRLGHENSRKHSKTCRALSRHQAVPARERQERRRATPNSS